jgi:Holliday junction resolvase
MSKCVNLVVLLPNKKYQAGYRFELSTKKKWEEKGFYVIRAAGSHGKADLVAIKINPPKYTEVYLIQCKTKGKISLQDRKELALLADSLGAVGVLSYKDERVYKEVWL